MIRAFFSIVIISSLCFSCSNAGKNPAQDSVYSSGPGRLDLYYPLDSTDKNGNKLYHTISERHLVSQDGKMFSTNSLAGKISVSDFFFARCAGTCPRMNSQVSRLQNAFRGNKEVSLVSFTVDPEQDTIAALQAYAERFKADTSQWKFITGDKKTIYDMARYDYYLAVAPGNGDSEDFIHSDQLVLVDRHERIRGYYAGTDSASVDSLIVDIKTLLKEK